MNEHVDTYIHACYTKVTLQKLYKKLFQEADIKVVPFNYSTVAKDATLKMDLDTE